MLMKDVKNSPGQPEFMHDLVLYVVPLQFVPPCFGDGLVHDLVLTVTPFPHELIQLPHKDQELQSPFTNKKQRKKEWKISSLKFIRGLGK